MDNEKIIAFNSYNENFVLSNMFPVLLEYKGNRFYGVDHLFHYLLYYQYPDIQNEIMKKSKGVCANYTAKKISEKNKDKIGEITDKQKVNLLKKCMRLKYQQSQYCKDYLLNTENNQLIEFAFWGDTFWGCIYKDGKYQGENNCGKILMEIRDELISFNGDNVK